MSSAPETPRKLHPTVLDTSAVQIAQVYAQALVDAASKANQLDRVLDEYESLLRDVLAAHPDFERMLTSALIGRNQKAETLRRALEGRTSQLFLNFMLVLCDHTRLDLLRPVLTQVLAIRDQRLGLVPVDVRAAVALDADQEQTLRDRLRS